MRSLIPNKIACFIALTIWVFQAGLTQTSYTTIENGQWSDPAIWSVNGVDPCDCTPPFILNTQVTVEHQVEAREDILLKDNGVLVITLMGSLDMPFNGLYVTNGKVYAYGRTELGQLEVGEHGYALFATNGHIDIALNVLGRMDIHFACFDTFFVHYTDLFIGEEGNLIVSNTAVVLADGGIDNAGILRVDNAALVSLQGAVKNRGEMQLSNNGYLSVVNGGFTNSGIVTGQGAVDAHTITMMPRSGWSGIAWCAANFDSGPPLGPNCASVDSISALTGQDVQTLMDGFDVGLKNASDNIHLMWMIDGERQVMLYEIQRATEDYEFMPIGWIYPISNPTYHSEYSFTDGAPYTGKSFYRVAVWGVDGTTVFSSVKEIKVAKTKSDVIN